uniref:Uncharacterized protein n=1 Tax=Acanthochromis polyacanthus TaxID=80966 RepID=A0A3Q1EQ57_9TELE
MKKQPSKESLKDKVKGIFGLGPPWLPSKKSDTKPSEFIIMTEMMKELHPDCGLINRLKMMNHVCNVEPFAMTPRLKVDDGFFGHVGEDHICVLSTW